MDGYRIVRIGLGPLRREWQLDSRMAVEIGRRDGTFVPGVDLSPDRRVSRRHARLRFDTNSWWIEDLGSLTGTRLAGRALPAHAPVRCELGATISVGDTALVIFGPGWQDFEAGGVALSMRLATRMSASLAAARIAPVVGLRAHNPGSVMAAPMRLDLCLPDAVDGATRTPRVAPGASKGFSLIRQEFETPNLLRCRDEQEARWEIRVDGVPLGNPAPGCTLLGADVWSHEEPHRASLASFVQPAHPRVLACVREATVGTAFGAGGRLFDRLFSYFAEAWRIDYRRDRSPAPRNSQRLRLANDILWDAERRVGEGTCIDLAILFAACLEALHQQTVIAVIDRGRSWHVLVGAWRQPHRRIELMPNDPERLLAEAEWVDPNACTREDRYRLPFAEACERARADLARSPLVFALDISVARTSGITPLPRLSGGRHHHAS